MSSKKSPLVDLTHPLDETMSCYPGDPPFKICCVRNVPSDGYTVHSLELGSHTGTHVDAPFHFFENGARLDKIPIDAFVGRAAVIDLRSFAAPSARISWSDVQEALASQPSLLDRIGSRDDGKLDIVLLMTGWDAHWGSPTYYQHPYLAKDVAEEFCSRGVRLLGVDTLSPDETTVDDGAEEKPDAFVVHRVILGQGKLICENLTNLKGLAGSQQEEGDGDIWVSLMPISIHESDGAPARAYGWREWTSQ
ncbi:putative cyclase [Coniophora puteana RWD-64-598 SS2]|uniref:Putative cyclase n=1 Tax=Coniophora puteana (strain RWD-64-598) TaxID=741705 RepID=A0A5M3MNG4_CONPW|nr:putative cyclase [Coniophora puteana RWD-64-598 SS2]EIW80265.1 putative cyclase [Coniophora puteana RWD-64-598 SS2]